MTTRWPVRTMLAPAAAALLLTACVGTGSQDVLAPKGPQAARIADFFWVSFVLAVLVFVAFFTVFGFALLRARRRARRGEPNALPPGHGMHLVLWGGFVVPAVILLALLVFSAYTDRQIGRFGRDSGDDPLEILVVGHQFWWELRYRDPLNPHREFATANEMHIPVGRPVKLILQSRDVIHSFWVPSLHGKTDLIPGRTNDLVIQADEPGIYRGQCAEFCGVQHAKMAMLVVASPPPEFEAWWDEQLRPHATPEDPLAAAGETLFMSRGCALCHTVRGTPARGTVGPDLSHLARRRTLGAATIPNTRGHLGGWIADPQGVKPGNHMPPVPLEGHELRALLSYLHSLR